MPFWFNRSCLEGILSSNQVAGLCIGVLGEIRSLKHGIMVLCGLDLREHRREAVLVHWVDSKLLLRFLLHCHSYCSYWQRGLERGMWQSRCNLSCTSWPSVGGPTPIFWRTVGMCFVLHTGRLMSGACEFSSVTRLWVSPEPGGACSMLKWPPSSGEVTQPQGCRQWIFYLLLAAQGLHLHITSFVAVCGISTSYSPFPWSPYRLSPC